jgi:enoyl-CoA hydratase/carnithine racemase
MAEDPVLLDVEDGIATVTLNRPEVINAFNSEMCDAMERIWRIVRLDNQIRVAVVQGAGSRGFCSGLDRNSLVDQEGTDIERNFISVHDNPWSRVSPVFQIAPKTCHVFKPVITAVHGIVAGGAFYWLAESDIIICADDTMFFDPHLPYGMVSPFIPAGLIQRGIPYGEVIRMALLGLNERMSPQRALDIGLVSEILPKDDLRSHAQALAKRIAAIPPSVAQGTIKCAWDSVWGSPALSLVQGTHYSSIGNRLVDPGDKESLETAGTREWTLR